MVFDLSPHHVLTLPEFQRIVKGQTKLGISAETTRCLDEVRALVDHLLKTREVVYGITTGFADLRKSTVDPQQAAQLSRNLIASHDGGIGEPLSEEIVLGAMVIRANALAKGYSGFQQASLQTLVDMINARIVPEIPCCGSLGASGDLALLARLGRAMCGEEVPVWYQGKRTSAREALLQEEIRPFCPQAKEGLALTNGTSFMASMAALGFFRQERLWNNFLALLPLFLESVHAVEAAFLPSIHEVRGQLGQKWIASWIRQCLKDSPFIDRKGVQNDYCIRCIPQILGSKLELMWTAKHWIERELEAVTDNPLLFKNPLEPSEKAIEFGGAFWDVLSGGNFHGEYCTTMADSMTMLNAKVALLLERQMTYLLNPSRNQHILPIYLIADVRNAGLLSGYMITQYTGNDLAQRIASLGVPASLYNLTSANESEDVVSYGSTACQKWLSQLNFFEDFLAVYLTQLMQAYALRRQNQTVNPLTHSERLFHYIQEEMGIKHPYLQDQSFEMRYAAAKRLLHSSQIGTLFPSRCMEEQFVMA